MGSLDFSEYIEFNPLRKINTKERNMLYSEEDYFRFRRDWVRAGISAETLDTVLDGIRIIDEDALQYGVDQMARAFVTLREYAERKHSAVLSLNDSASHSTGFFKNYVVRHIVRNAMYPYPAKLFTRPDMPVCFPVGVTYRFPQNSVVVVLDDWSITGCNHDNEIFTVKEFSNLTPKHMYFGYLGLTHDGIKAVKRDGATLIANSFIIPHACELLELSQIKEISKIYDYNESLRLGADILTFAYGDTYKDVPDNFANFLIHPNPDYGISRALITIPEDAR